MEMGERIGRKRVIEKMKRGNRIRGTSKKNKIKRRESWDEIVLN